MNIDNLKVSEDMVNHPGHYTFGQIETIDYMKDVLSKDEFYGACVGNVIKYVSRARHKGNTIQDLEKARWYLDTIINSLKNDTKTQKK